MVMGPSPAVRASQWYARWPWLWVLLIALPAAAAEFVAPYVNTVQEDVDLMLDLAEVRATDYLIDLGAGDGRIVITAALRGAMGHGVELDRELVELARRRARQAEVEARVLFLHGDVFEAELSRASVVTMYLMPEVNLRLRPKLLAELAPGTRVLSNSFDMGDWRPDAHVYGRTSGGIRLWIVPARVAGDWRLDLGGGSWALRLEQQFQDVTATLARDGTALEVEHVRLRGDRIAFGAGDGHRQYAFNGRVQADRMEGLVQIHDAGASRLLPWRATLSGGR